MLYKKLKLLLLLSSLAANITFAQLTTIDVTPAQDNTLYERPLGDLSNGAGEHLFFGMTGANANNVLRRALIAFDFSAIPPGSEIMDAQLSVTVNMVPPLAGSFDASMHRVLTDWGEGTSDAPGPEGGGTSSASDDATWIHTFFDTQLWSNPGGDFVATPSAITNINNANGDFTFASAQLITDIQAMVDDPSSNFGWVILGDETDPMNARRIASRDNADAATAPSLEVTFEPGEIVVLPVPTAVPAINSYGLVLLGLLLLGSIAIRGHSTNNSNA